MGVVFAEQDSTPPVRDLLMIPGYKNNSITDRPQTMQGKLQQAFALPTLEQQWDSIVEDWRQDFPDSEEISAALRWIRGLRDEVMDAADTIDDTLELEETLAIRYIKYKSTWIMLNTKLQYQMMRHGTPNQDDLHRASLVTTLISALESALGREDVQQIEAFLADPIRR